MWTPLLAQRANAEQVGELLTALGWLVGAAVVTVLIGVAIYKRFSPNRYRDEGPITFSLSALRRMRDEGQISEEEFLLARERVIGESQDLMESGRGADSVRGGGDSDKRR